MNMNIKTKKIVYILVVIMLCALTIFCGQAELYAQADTTTLGVRAAYENTNVWDNLQGSTIGGNLFSIDDYPHVDNGTLQIISFVEFCYSLYSDKQGDYGLYVYIYNPQDVVIDTDTERDKIQMQVANLPFAKYDLVFLNYSNKAGYEGRFYKFRIELTANQRHNILTSLNNDSRVYQISGIELSIKGEVKEYSCAQKYTYTGFVKGYGSELAESDTLSCSVDGFDKYIQLDVKHTFYRPEGDYYNGEQSQLNSCYFRVPDKFFTDYGELSKIVCEWYEYFTKPILVTESNYVFNKINALHGSSTKNLSDDMYILAVAFWENIDSSWFGKAATTVDLFSNYPYKKGDKIKFGIGGINGSVDIVDDVGDENFSTVFYTGEKSYKDYEIDGDALKQKLLTNSSYLGGELLNDRYSKELFEDYVQNGYEYGFNHKEVKADDMQEIFWHVTTKKMWQKMFGGFDVDTLYDSKQAIEILSSSDLTGSDSEIASRLYINNNDVASLKSEFAKAQKNNERVVLFRYSTTQYMSAPATVVSRSKNVEDVGKELMKSAYDNWDDEHFNAYVAQETVYLDFDIISLWFTADGVETEIPVISSPTDVISGLTPPLDEDYHNKKEKSLLEIFIAVVALALIVILLYIVLGPVLPIIFKGVVWIITLPFKLLGALFKGISKATRRK